MMWSTVAALLWLILANVIAMFPSKDYHWSNAYKLIAIALPLTLWLAYENGPLWAAAFLIAAGSILRWPLRYLWRWFRSRLAR